MKINTGLALLFTVLFAFFLYRLIPIAAASHWNGFDSSLFVHQAFGLVDGKFAELGLDRSRPRLLVGVLGVFAFIYRTLFSKLPSLPSLHLFMLVVNSSFLFFTYLLVSRIYSRLAALLTVLLLLAQPIFVQQSIECLADILSGTMVVVFFYYVDRKLFLKTPPATTRTWIVLGMIGALIGMGKYTLLPLFPIFCGALVAIALWGKYRNQKTLDVDAAQMGISFLTFVLTLEAGHRIFGAWDAGLWSDVREALSLGFVLPSLNGITSRPVTAEPWYFYLKTLWDGNGPVLWLAFAISGLAFLFFRRDKREKNYTAGLFVGISALFLILHFVLSHKEDRYLLPSYPALFAVVALPLSYWLTRLGSRFAFVAFPALGLLLFSSLGHSSQEIQKLEDFAKAPQGIEFQSLVSNLEKNPVTGRACRKLYACEYTLPFIKLDAPIYKSYLPRIEAYTRFCEHDERSLTSLRPFLMNRVIDDIDETSCFIGTRSGGDGSGVGNFHLHIPLQLDMNREDAFALMAQEIKGYENVDCVPTDGERKAGQFDCYLTKSYFTDPASPARILSRPRSLN